MSRVSSKNINKPTPKKKTESFASGLFSLMVKQCVYSAIIFGAIYYVKLSDLSLSKSICSFIKSAVGYEFTAETIKNITSGLFL